MRSEASWQEQETGIHFGGCWDHQSVAKAWVNLAPKEFLLADVTDITQLDSSFVALLACLSPVNRPLKLVGVSAQMVSLLTLYNLRSVFDLEQDAV